MKSRRIFALAAVALAVTLPAGPAPAGDTATVNVTITVLPYAEVTLASDTVDVPLPKGAAQVTVDVAGSVVCNYPVWLYARITPPEDAPGDWTAHPGAVSIEGGAYDFDPLLRIIVWDIPDGPGQTFEIGLSANSAASPEEIETPGVGEATITVVAQ